MNRSHFVPLCLSIPFVFLGCTRLEVVPRVDMQPGRMYQRSLVYLKDGTRYEFRRVSFRPDSLVGEYRVTVEHPADQAGLVYEDETRAFALPLARVDSVAVIRRDPMKTLFYGAGMAAVGYAIYELVNSDNLGKSSSNDGSKPGQGGPDGK